MQQPLMVYQLSMLPLASVQEQPELKFMPKERVEKLINDWKDKKITNPQTREVIKHVLQECQNECVRGQLVSRLSAPATARVSHYTGISTRTVQRIRRVGRRRKITEGIWTYKKRVRHYKAVLDDRDITLINNTIRDYYIKHVNVPSIRFLTCTISDQIPTYKYAAGCCLEFILTYLGYRRKRYYSKQYVLVEDPSVMALQDKYLNKIRELRKNFDRVFYVYECIIDKSYTLHKAWLQKYNYHKALKDQHTFTFICAASQNGFVKSCCMLAKTILTHGSGQLTHAVFENWLKQSLIPNLPKNSVIIVDDGPHHCVESEKTLQYHATKLEMCKFLNGKGIICNENMRRSQLFKLVQQYTPKHKVYVIDALLKEHGHEVVRLPPYMIDFNLLQYAMDKIQQKLFNTNIKCDFAMQNVIEIMGHMMSFVTADDWKTFNEKTARLEEEYRIKNEKYEDAIDKVFLNFRDCVDAGTSDSSEESELESDIET